MCLWIKKHIALSIGLGLMIIVILLCSGAILILSNYSQIKRVLWEQSQPEKYYIKIRYSYSRNCPRTWESVWEDDKLINLISDEVSMHNLCTEEDLDISDWSMDYVFDVIVENCGKGAGAVLCNVEYDPHSHYPSKVTSYYLYVFEVQDFVACDPDKSQCP